jgi:hypothetical protein
MNCRLAVVAQCFALLASPHAHADTRVDVSADVDRETRQPHPEFAVEWTYDEASKWFSAFEYRQAEHHTTDVVGRFEDSKLAARYSEKAARLVLIGRCVELQSAEVRLSGAAQYRHIDNTEFGYFTLPEDGGVVAFENQIGIRAVFPSLRLGLNVSLGPVRARTRVDAYPSYLLSVEQNTHFKPLLDEPSSGTASRWQSPALSLYQDIYVETGTIVDLYIKARLDKWSTDYDIDVLDRDAGSGAYIWSASAVGASYLNYSVSANVVLASRSGGARPYLGIGYQHQSVAVDGQAATESDGTLTIAVGLQLGK